LASSDPSSGDPDAVDPAAFDRDDPRAVRRAIRSGAFTGFTNLVARNSVQGNLMIVPQAYAADFEAYARANAQALPIIGVSRPGSPHIPEIAEDLDLRTDVGGYMVFRDGALVDTPRTVENLWREDLTAFVLGCSFSFEALLQRHGVRLRHLEEGEVSAMYVTDIPTVPVGPFAGPLVVSMRALSPKDAILATLISDRYPEFHGAPVHIGLPELIGVQDLTASYGGHGMQTLRSGELPVFWACGATAQVSALAAKLPFCITHYKAHMVVTDLQIPAPKA
jgi:uncharacterized protein YcsI (UPF0317 family)